MAVRKDQEKMSNPAATSCGSPNLATMVEASAAPLFLAAARATSICSVAICDSGTAVIPLILPCESNSRSTTSPGVGGTSDFHTPSRRNWYCCPSTINKPGPACGSRKTFPLFDILPPLQVEEVEKSPGIHRGVRPL